MRSFLLLFFTCIALSSLAQVGNEWIDYNQAYYKIPVAKENIYKLNYADLQAAGFPVGGIDPKKIQLFHRGEEQAIFVEGEDDSDFGSSDYIEFYGQQNDGTLDAELYKPASLQPDRQYNLYSDTTSYFLTVGATNGKRIPFFDETNSGLPAE